VKFPAKLLGLVLGQALGDVGQSMADWLADYTRDPSGTLPKAIAQANERSWQVLELALAGEGLSGRLQQFFARGELTALCQPIQQVIAAQGGEPFRRQCLKELQAARRAGLLQRSAGHNLVADAGGFARFTNPEALLDAAWGLMGQAAAELSGPRYARPRNPSRGQIPRSGQHSP